MSRQQESSRTPESPNTRRCDPTVPRPVGPRTLSAGSHHTAPAQSTPSQPPTPVAVAASIPLASISTTHRADVPTISIVTVPGPTTTPARVPIQRRTTVRRHTAIDPFIISAPTFTESTLSQSTQSTVPPPTSTLVDSDMRTISQLADSPLLPDSTLWSGYESDSEFSEASSAGLTPLDPQAWLNEFKSAIGHGNGSPPPA